MKMNIVIKVIEHNFKCDNVYKSVANFISQNMESMLKFTSKVSTVRHAEIWLNNPISYQLVLMHDLCNSIIEKMACMDGGCFGCIIIFKERSSDNFCRSGIY